MTQPEKIFDSLDELFIQNCEQTNLAPMNRKITELEREYQGLEDTVAGQRRKEREAHKKKIRENEHRIKKLKNIKSISKRAREVNLKNAEKRKKLRAEIELLKLKIQDLDREEGKRV